MPKCFPHDAWNINRAASASGRNVPILRPLLLSTQQTLSDPYCEPGLACRLTHCKVECQLRWTRGVVVFFFLTDAKWFVRAANSEVERKSVKSPIMKLILKFSLYTNLQNITEMTNVTSQHRLPWILRNSNLSQHMVLIQVHILTNAYIADIWHGPAIYRNCT